MSLKELLLARLEETSSPRGWRAVWLVSGLLALGLCLLALLTRQPARSEARALEGASEQPAPETSDKPDRVCPVGTLPDNGVCVPVPSALTR